MLVLTRRNKEAIMLGDDIKITILEIDNDRIKIGIEAPHATKIMRAELLTEIKNVNREATQTNLGFMQAINDTDTNQNISNNNEKKD